MRPMRSSWLGILPEENSFTSQSQCQFGSCAADILVILHGSWIPGRWGIERLMAWRLRLPVLGGTQHAKQLNTCKFIIHMQTHLKVTKPGPNTESNRLQMVR